MLQVYNSLTRVKQPFIPLVPGKIGMYVCGITVYDLCHLGHARSMVCFDMMVRYLRSQGFEVTYVRNITDIDDKIIAKMHDKKASLEELTGQYIAAMHEDAASLNLIVPDLEPRATQHIDVIINLIQRLLDKNHAYISENEDVCYSVDSFADYGKLSNKNLDDLISGSRVEIVKEKRSPLDFVLWKKAKPDEPSWDSPWGKGRPGWHIECSAMAMYGLGEQFDIHGGGIDLQFPHHENEVAQSEAATEKPFANYWLHIGMLQINHEKMAKSLGNFFTIRDVLKKHHPEVIRYFLLSSHYRSPLNYSEAHLINAKKSLMRLYQCIKEIKDLSAQPLDAHWVDQFNQAMDDDFNSPMALSVLFQLSHEINKTNSPQLGATLKYLGAMLGILQVQPHEFLQSSRGDAEDAQAIEELIAQRAAARAARDWTLADQLRAQLLQQGVELEDQGDKTMWRRTQKS